MFNSIKHRIEDGIKMAIAEEIVRIFKPDKRKEEKTYTQEERDKLQKMRKIKGDVQAPSPDYKQRHKIK